MIKKDYKVSIIIPIFNAEKTLERAIVSVMNQTIGFDNIELILVDDNSSDNSQQIINSFSNKYENIVPIFLQKNSGWASKPRNIGMKESSSPLIMFMDSDDEYEERMCETLVNTINNNDCDLASCDINFDPHNSKEKKLDDLLDMVQINLTGEECLQFDPVYVTNKVFKKSIIQKNNIEFYERISEDFIFCIEYLLNIDKGIYLNGYLGYLKHAQQLSLSIHPISETEPYEHMEVGYYVYNLIRQNVPDISGQSIDYIFENVIRWVIHETMSLDKELIIDVFKDLKLFEEHISFTGSFGIPFTNLINRLIMSGKWGLILILYDLRNFSRNNKILLRICEFF